MFWTRVAAGGGACWLVVWQPGAALAAVVCAYAVYSVCDRYAALAAGVVRRLGRRLWRWAR